MTPHALFGVLIALPLLWGWSVRFVLGVGAVIMRDLRPGGRDA